MIKEGNVLPTHPSAVASAKGLSHLSHILPVTPDLHSHWPVPGSHDRLVAPPLPAL